MSCTFHPAIGDIVHLPAGVGAVLRLHRAVEVVAPGVKALAVDGYRLAT